MRKIQYRIFHPIPVAFVLAFVFFSSLFLVFAQNDTTTGRVWGPNLTLTGILQGSRLTSTVATGTAPLTVTSTTNVPNLNASLAVTQSQLDNSTKIATTAYADLAVSNAVGGVNPAVAVLAASTASITGTYSNGVAGIGATFTVTATGSFTLDGVAIGTIGQRVLLKDQSTGFQNGVYTATVVGSVAVQPVFTRALDYDTPSDINSTGAIPVQNGTVNISTSWLLTSTVTTVGTDALTYVQFSINPTVVVTRIASGTKALATSSIASGACTAAQTATATGTLTTDTVMADFNADPTGVTGYAPVTTGMLTIIKYPTADTVNFKICNLTATAITPGAITLNFRVVR